jgi:tetratricopeptide (TPR) repeat protein
LVRAGRLEAVPGQIIRLTPRKQWRQASRVHLSGDIEFTKTSASDLGISPLSLHERGVWQPSDYASLDARQPLEHWQRAMVARGPRPAFEMEQVIPGYDERLRPSVDPILHAAELFNSGDARGARSCLGTLLEADLRCLDAHAHLGSFAFEYLPQEALRHYEVGLRIGELSLYDGFDGLLPSCFPDNRPFLRCLHGHGLTLWRLGRFDEAERALSRLLWLDPIDDQGVSALLPVLRSKVTWQEYRSLR